MKSYKISEVAKVVAGSTAPKDNCFNLVEGLPFIRAGHLDFLCRGGNIEELPKIDQNNGNKLIKVPSGTLIFAKSGMSCMKNRIYITRKEAYIVSHLAGIICNNEGININYLKYYFDMYPPNRLVNDLAYPSIRLGDVENIEIDFPTIEIQNNIVDILDKIMKLISIRKIQIEACDELIKSQFIEIFGDPRFNTMSLPIVTLSDLGIWNSGGTPARSNPAFFQGNIDWYSAGELNSLYLDGSVERITEDAIDHSAAKIFKQGSMLIGMYDTAAFKMGILKKDSSSNQACACIEPNEKVNIVWLYYELQLMKDFFLSQRRGVRQKNLNLGMIKSFEVPLAGILDQNDFAVFVEKINKSKSAMKKSLEEMETLYKSLLQKYFG